MMRRTLLAALMLFLSASFAWAMTPEERREYTQKLVEILQPSQPFTDWLASSGEIAPDFDALPKHNGLPDPFTFFDGKRKVQTPQDWQDRRKEIRQLFEKYILGSIPPKPNLDKVVELTPEQIAADAAARGGGRGFAGGRAGGRGPATGPVGNAAAGGAPARAGRGGGGPGGRGGAAAAEGSITKVVDLFYGPEGKISQRVTVVIPPGTGPFPVLMGGGANVTARGYISCTIPSNVDRPPDIGQYYPGYDWGSMAKCAWSTQMVVDYLYTLPEVDKKCIAITGYSRGGKYATISAAIDERITAVVAGSTGVGGVLTWRQGSEANVGESIESTTRMFPIWFTPRIRFFAGREDRLPVDGNLLVDLVAPRSIMMLYGLNDEVSNTWGNEQTYYDTHKLYSFLGVPDRVSIDRPFGHHGANDQQGVMDWLDIQFGKSTAKWENKFLFPWSFEKWKQASGETVDLSKYPPQATAPLATAGDSNALINPNGRWEGRADAIIRAVRWVLGEAPSSGALAKQTVSNPGDEGIDDTPRWVINRSIIEHGWTRQQAQGIAVKDIRFGPGKIRADIYYKADTAPGTKLPTVIFLHGNSYPLGYMWVYRMDPHPIIALANAGYAVLAFDQTSYGSRMNEAAGFYDLYPKWSQMGRMVADAQAAVEAARTDELCDGRKIYLFGYGTGGAVALHAAALTADVKGVVSICGFTPMRTDTPDKMTGGIARVYEQRGLLPRLGFFAGEEARIPYDYNELIATIAPRPVYIYSPEFNREATAADVKAAVEQARSVYQTQYNAGGKLVLDQPFEYFRLSGPAQDRIVEWMKTNMQ